MKTKIISICFLLVISLVYKVEAQQDPHFSLYKYNLSVLNPAVAGSSGGKEFYAGVRDQWNGIPDAPRTQTFNYNQKVGDRLGVGLNIVADNVFIVQETHLYADVSYRLSVNKNTDLFFGIKFGGSFLNIDLNELGNDTDPLLSGNVSRFNPNFGVGAYIEKEKYFISLSIPGLLKADRIEKNGLQSAIASDRVHAFLSGGYNAKLNEKWILKPATMLRLVTGAPLSLDFTLSAQYADKFEFGGNYRVEESFTTFISFIFDDFARAGFAYEHTTTDVGDFNTGTPEIFLKFNF